VRYLSEAEDLFQSSAASVRPVFPDLPKPTSGSVRSGTLDNESVRHNVTDRRGVIAGHATDTA